MVNGAGKYGRTVFLSGLTANTLCEVYCLSVFPLLAKGAIDKLPVMVPSCYTNPGLTDTVQTYGSANPLVLLIDSPLNNPLNNTMLYVLSKFISRVLVGINTYIHFIWWENRHSPGHWVRAAMADNEKGFPLRIPFARNPSRLNRSAHTPLGPMFG